MALGGVRVNMPEDLVEDQVLSVTIKDFHSDEVVANATVNGSPVTFPHVINASTVFKFPCDGGRRVIIETSYQGVDLSPAYDGVSPTPTIEPNKYFSFKPALDGLDLANIALNLAPNGGALAEAQTYYGYDATQFGPESITPTPGDGAFAVGVDPASGWYDVYQRIDGAWVDTDPDSNNIQEALIRNAAREETTNLGLDALVDFYGAPITEISVLTTIFNTAFTAGQAQAFLDVSKGELIISVAANTSDTSTLLGLFTPGYPIRGNVAIAGNWDGYVTKAFAASGTWGTGVVTYLRLFDDVSVNNVSSAMDVPDSLVPQSWFVNGSSTGALFSAGVFGATDVSNRFLVKNNENTRWVAGPVMEDFVVDDASTTTSVWDAQAQQIVVSVNQNLLNDLNADIADKIAKSTLGAKGSLVTASAASTPAELTVGTNGQVLQADSSKPSGLTWATPVSVYRQTLTGSGVEGQSFTVTHNLGVEAVTLSLWDTSSHTVSNVFDATAWEITASTTSGFTLTPQTTIPVDYTYVLTVVG